MTTWIAFLRAINLGRTRKLPKASIVAATERAGGRRVETYINTGNVRLDHDLDDRREVERVLEAAYAAEAGFEVPTICVTPAELREIAEVAAGLGEAALHYVSLLKEEPTAEAVAALGARADDAHRVHVAGRGVHLVLTGPDYRTSRITNTHVERHLDTSTNRNLTVIRTLAEKWT